MGCVKNAEKQQEFGKLKPGRCTTIAGFAVVASMLKTKPKQNTRRSKMKRKNQNRMRALSNQMQDTAKMLGIKPEPKVTWIRLDYIGKKGK